MHMRKERWAPAFRSYQFMHACTCPCLIAVDALMGWCSARAASTADGKPAAHSHAAKASCGVQWPLACCVWCAPACTQAASAYATGCRDQRHLPCMVETPADLEARLSCMERCKLGGQDLEVRGNCLIEIVHVC